MTVEIIQPRRVAACLSCTRKGAAYRVDVCLRSFLEARGWTLQKTGSSYATMLPPDKQVAPFLFEIYIPTRDQVLAVAKEKHGLGTPWAGKFGEWSACYIPPQNYTTTEIDLFTAQAISKPKPGGIIAATFYVGARMFWHAEVRFQNETAAYHESDTDPIQSQPTGFVSPDEIPEGALLVEGATCCITVNAYERNAEARRQCIEAHGTNCCICGFTFSELYGNLAEGYIHVHHLRPLSEIGLAYVVDPVEDLRPVCPNCHAVLHLGGRCRSIEEVQELVQRQRFAE